MQNWLSYCSGIRNVFPQEVYTKEEFRYKRVDMIERYDQRPMARN